MSTVRTREQEHGGNEGNGENREYSENREN